MYVSRAAELPGRSRVTRNNTLGEIRDTPPHNCAWLCGLARARPVTRHRSTSAHTANSVVAYWSHRTWSRRPQLWRATRMQARYTPNLRYILIRGFPSRHTAHAMAEERDVTTGSTQSNSFAWRSASPSPSSTKNLPPQHHHSLSPLRHFTHTRHTKGETSTHGWRSG
jgi:hypothetical protein